MPVEGTKVRILGPGANGSGSSDRWQRAAKAVLGLDEAGAERMLAALPRNVLLTGSAAAARERIVKQFARESIAVEVLPDPVRADPCAAHPRALVAEECPHCHERRACALCLYANAVPRCAACSGRARFWTRFRHVRVGILLAILAAVAWDTYGTKWRLQNWSRSVTVAIYPVAADPGADVSSWASSVGEPAFADVRDFIEREGHRYGIDHSDLVALRFGKAFSGDLPPAPPPQDSKLKVALWSFQLRWWNFRMKWKHHLPGAEVEIYVLYHAPSSEKALDHSLGIEKLRLGIVNALAGRENEGWTALATAHELLHTVGASDKYGPSGMPVFPEGFAEPERRPLLPQSRCEVMAGQVPLTDHTFVQASRLDECLIGEKTAREIGWRK